MRASIVLSLALSTAVLGNPMMPSGSGQGVPGASQGGLGTQQMSTSKQAQGYADNRGPQEQDDLRKAQQIGAQVMDQNPQIPQSNVRAGVHSGGSQGANQVTLQVPAHPGQYSPPSSGNPGQSGVGSAAAHVPAQDTGYGGPARIDPTRPIVTKPDPGTGQQGNKDQGKTASYYPPGDYPLPGQPPRKRDLSSVRRELLRRNLAMRELLERDLMASANYFDWE